MKYYLVITPQPLIDALLDESRRLLKTVYNKEVDLLYYRVETKQELDNPRRLFIKGDGRVIETQVKPHISLIHNIELENPEDFILEARDICSKYAPIELTFNGVGNYDMDFTFFVGFNPEPELEKLRNDLLSICKSHMSEEEYHHNVEKDYIPHATLLYDDVDPEKVMEAYRLLDRTKFNKNIPVLEIVLWEVSAAEQKPIAAFKLGS